MVPALERVRLRALACACMPAFHSTVCRFPFNVERERVRDVGEGALGLNLTVLALGGIREAAKLNFSVSLVDDKEGLGLGEEMVALRREGSALESLSAKAHAGKGEAGQEEEDDAVRAEDGVFCRGVEVRAERGCVSSRAWAGKRMRLFVSAGLYLLCACIYARERESARARERECVYYHVSMHVERMWPLQQTGHGGGVISACELRVQWCPDVRAQRGHAK